jgi:hypothetical protein
MDIGSLSTGAFWVALWARRQMLRTSPNAFSLDTIAILSRSTGTNFATGVSLFAFFLLVMTPLSSQLLAGLLDGNKAGSLGGG